MGRHRTLHLIPIRIDGGGGGGAVVVESARTEGPKHRIEERIGRFSHLSPPTSRRRAGSLHRTLILPGRVSLRREIQCCEYADV